MARERAPLQRAPNRHRAAELKACRRVRCASTQRKERVNTRAVPRAFVPLAQVHGRDSRPRASCSSSTPVGHAELAAAVWADLVPQRQSCLTWPWAGAPAPSCVRVPCDLIQAGGSSFASLSRGAARPDRQASCWETGFARSAVAACLWCALTCRVSPHVPWRHPDLHGRWPAFSCSAHRMWARRG